MKADSTVALSGSLAAKLVKLCMKVPARKPGNAVFEGNAKGNPLDLSHSYQHSYAFQDKNSYVPQGNLETRKEHDKSLKGRHTETH